MAHGADKSAHEPLAPKAERHRTMDDSQPMERRLVVRLLQYWRGLADDGFPREAEIDSQTIADIWPYCALLDTEGKETDPEFLYVGAQFATGAADLTRQRLSSALPNTLLSQGLSYFGQVLTRKAPISFGGEFTDAAGVKILYRSVILPLSKHGVSISGLLAAANCRPVALD